MWYLIIILAIIYYYFKSNTIIITCNADENDRCKMYNQRDVQTKCESLCAEKDKQYKFSGKYFKTDNVHNCECKIELFTQVGNNPDILPEPIPTDEAFSDRNYVEKMQEDRFKKLIFG